MVRCCQLWAQKGRTSRVRATRLRLLPLRDHFTSTRAIANQWVTEHGRLAGMRTVYRRIWSFGLISYRPHFVLPFTRERQGNRQASRYIRIPRLQFIPWSFRHGLSGVENDCTETRNGFQASLVTNPDSVWGCVMPGKGTKATWWKACALHSWDYGMGSSCLWKSVSSAFYQKQYDGPALYPWSSGSSYSTLP